MIPGSVRLITAGMLIWQLTLSAAFAQQKYPALIAVISFEELRKKAIERKVAWTNPNGTREEMTFVEMAIPFDQAMVARTKEFVQSVYGIDSIWLNPKMIVFHAMGDGDLKTSLKVSSFLNDEIPASWGKLSLAGKLPNTAHFIVDSDGTIICLSPPLSRGNGKISYARDNHRWTIKRHQDGNPVAIGIENVTAQRNYESLTSAQRNANAQLARWLIWFENGKIAFIASHHQFNDEGAYAHFLDSFHLQNLKKEFRTRGRKDIGDKTMTAIQNEILRFGISVTNFFR